jgi:Ethanolamine utilization protein EutJ (predicted chaperonin)
MTFQIAKSVIDGLPYNYTESVEAFRQAKRIEHSMTHMS